MKTVDPHYSVAKISHLCSLQDGKCSSCAIQSICGIRVSDWPKAPSINNPTIRTLHDLYDAAQEKYSDCQCPTLTVKGFTNVQRYLGLRTSIEKESVAIQQKAYPFAHATNMTHSEYSIFSIPYLQWIKERSDHAQE